MASASYLRTWLRAFLFVIEVAGMLWFGTTAAQAGTITVGMVDGTAGQQVVVGVTLQPAGSEQIAGTQNDVTAATGVAIAPKSSGKCSTATTTTCSADADCPAGQFCKKAPDCAVNPVILKGGTTFGFLPSGCSGAACTGVRALVFALDNTDPIPDNVTMYTCKYNVAATASGTIVLTNSNVTCSGPTGGDVPCGAVSGSIITCRGPAVIIGNVNATAGQQGLDLPVTLCTDGQMIAGTQNDLTPGTGAAIAAKSNGKPDCSVNAAISKVGTTFGFLPAGCSGAACTVVRALVFALDNTNPIPNGSLLYTCKINVAASATGMISVVNSGPTCSDPNGRDVPCGAVSGSIVIGRTPTPTKTVSPTPTPVIVLSLGMAQGAPGTQVSIAVSLFADGADIAGAQNDITFDPSNVPIAALSNGQPNCIANPEINKRATTFGFLPSGCRGASCTAVRAVVFALDNTKPITDGSTLYICHVNIAASAAPETYPLRVSGIVLSDPGGGTVSGATGIDGEITVQPPVATLRVGLATGFPGQQVTFAVTLSNTGGAQVAGAQMDIAFDSVNTPIAATPGGLPDCAVNPDINKRGTTFAFLPGGCSGATCTRMRALVFALDNTNPIPDGSTLYTCHVNISATAAPGNYPLGITGITLSTPQGSSVPSIGTNGAIIVGPVPPTPSGVELRVGDTALSPGQESVAIPVFLTNAVGVRAVQFVLTDVPELVTLSPTLPCGVSSRGSALFCGANQVGNEITVVLLATGASGVSPGEGQIASVFVDDTLPSCAVGSVTQLHLSQSAVADDNGDPVPHTLVNGSLLCGCKGDVDQNGETDVFDALASVDFILGRRTPAAEQRVLSDLTCDGTIDVFDALRILDVILGRRPACPVCSG